MHFKLILDDFKIDDMHESIQMKEKATAALRERVTQVETVS
jgi:hypothetical protein